GGGTSPLLDVWRSCGGVSDAVVPFEFVLTRSGRDVELDRRTIGQRRLPLDELPLWSSPIGTLRLLVAHERRARAAGQRRREDATPARTPLTLIESTTLVVESAKSSRLRIDASIFVDGHTMSHS